MHFNHYGGEAALLAADLVNLPTPHTPQALEVVLTQRGIQRTSLTPREAESVQHWSSRLEACFGPQSLEDRRDTINELLGSATSSPYISTHDGHPHLHYSTTDQGPVAQIKAVTATGLAYVVCFASPGRLGRCSRTGCDLAFVDTSRNGRRAYCTVRCSNNDAVARHRAAHSDQWLKS
ncbi:CGNR zinc finger domain-containing protein [Streptomyces sp. NPDC002602]|uniref:CGNR zinc finger domain-containing protein n=1 Tax=Streptomyces sp. NPDC002602 TaxID=3364654 RepID=UPI0036A12716